MTSGAVGGLAESEDQLRLMVRIARMYHERGMRQGEIAAELHVSQPRVSRLLKRASEVGIVRTTVVLPAGVHADIEQDLERTLGLREAVVVDAWGREEELNTSLGSAAAAYLEATLIGGDTVGISSWSATLLAAVRAMHTARSTVVDTVVQVVGGVGDPQVQVLANRLIAGFAQATGAAPAFLPAPGVLGTASARRALTRDPAVSSVMDLWRRLTMVVVGIGALEPSPLLQQSGNAVSPEDVRLLRDAGAVGDICLRYFDAAGAPVRSSFDERVVGISAAQLLAVPRRVAVAGGERKAAAILGAVRGGWVNVLVTDLATARQLLKGA
jgi:DNA-binding transcriptional regulator LsrR (DeoR family)